MKKNICIALTFFGLFISYSACFSQEAERRLYWVPGLNERNVFWQRYFERFPITHRVRQDQSQNTDHLSNQNITNLSNFVGAPLNGHNNDPVLEQPIGIGHSMGGLMARDIDRQWIGPAKKFCSIVTVGTPNQGAFAVNAVQSGMVEQAYLRATRAVALGPAYDAVSGAVGYIFNGDYTAGVVSGITMMFAGKEVVGFIGKSIWDANFGGFIQNYNTPPASEMAVGSNRMSQFGAPNVPAISIWGNEDGPMIYRMATVAERTADIPNDPLDYSTDSKYVNWATTLASSYQGAKYAHGIYSIVTGFLGIFTLNPMEVAVAAYHASAVVAYDEGRSYLLWDAENDYRRIIAATWVETIKTKPDYRTYNTTTKTWVKLPRMDSDNEPDIKQMRDNWSANTYSLVHIKHDDPADGLISKPSQNGINGLTTSYEAKGAGHLEQGNHLQVRLRLNNIFDRINEPYYFTPERQ